MSRIAKYVAPVYPLRARQRGRTQVVHYVIIETWRDAAGQHRVAQAKALCGVNAARYTESSTTPVRCQVCISRATADGLPSIAELRRGGQ